MQSNLDQTRAMIEQIAAKLNIGDKGDAVSLMQSGGDLVSCYDNVAVPPTPAQRPDLRRGSIFTQLE